MMMVTTITICLFLPPLFYYYYLSTSELNFSAKGKKLLKKSGKQQIQIHVTSDKFAASKRRVPMCWCRWQTMQLLALFICLFVCWPVGVVATVVVVVVVVDSDCNCDAMWLIWFRGIIVAIHLFYGYYYIIQ